MTDNSQKLRAVVVANGDVPPIEQLATRLPMPSDGLLVIAADGGLRQAERLGLAAQLVVGDGDSLAPEELERLADAGVEVQLHPVDKDATDTELAIREAMRRGASEIVLLGALGGVRFEHALANVLLLALPELAGRDVRLIDGRSTIHGMSGGELLSLEPANGRLVSLLPLSPRVEGVRTSGLRFALHGETLEQGLTRGLSNEIDEERATIEIEAGRLAVVQTRLGDDAPHDGAAR